MHTEAAIQSEVPLARAVSRNRSSVFAPIPRVGRFTTRSNEVSSRGSRSAQIGERILDFRALEEPQAPIHQRHACVQERLFEHPRLRVRAVQHRDFAARAAALHPFANAITTKSARRAR